MLWCKERVLSDTIDPLACFSMGQIANHEFDEYGNDSGLVRLINEIQTRILLRYLLFSAVMIER